MSKIVWYSNRGGAPAPLPLATPPPVATH